MTKEEKDTTAAPKEAGDATAAKKGADGKEEEKKGKDKRWSLSAPVLLPSSPTLRPAR